MIQLQYINYLLASRDASSLLVNNIDESFFSDYTDEYRFIKNQLDTYGCVPDKITFADKFTRFDFIEVKDSPSYLLDELYDDKNKRMLASTFNSVRDAFNKGDTQKAIALFKGSVENFASATHITATDLFSDKSRYDTYVERTQDFSRYYVRPGFKELDDAVGGWDRLEELGTIVARPGVGKSWILLKCALASAEQGLKAGLYSGEMTTNKVGYRVDTLLGHVSNRKIMRGDVEVQTEYKKYIDSMNELVKGKIYVITPSDLGHPATITDMRAFIEKYDLDILFIDQHSLMEDERRGRDAITRASNISRDLKHLQTMKKIPIIAVSQQNRSLVEEDKVIDVSHIAQADRIGQDSTIVLFLEQKDGVLTIHLAKARDSVSGSKLKYSIDLDHGIFSFLPAEDDALGGSGCDDLRAEFDGALVGEEPF
jgi:replicative DNA helicase